MGMGAEVVMRRRGRSIRNEIGGDAVVMNGWMDVYGCYTPGHGYDHGWIMMRRRCMVARFGTDRRSKESEGPLLGVRMEVLRSLWEGWSR
jgi:hypothetical protein